MSRPFVTIIITNRFIIRSVALAGIADKLEQMKGIAVVLVKPEKVCIMSSDAARGFGNKIDIVDNSKSWQFL